MKRLLFGSLSFLLLSSASVPIVMAETASNNLGNLSQPSDFSQQITPVNLVSLAYRGYLKQQGIPSYMALLSAHQMGQIDAKDIIKAAVDANQLSSQLLTDEKYLRAVEFALETLSSR